jgi:hypothetical protein
MLLSKGGINRKAVAKITEWVRLRVDTSRARDENIQIFVAETECRDVGCVPLEVLIILIGPTRRWPGKILKPIVEVTKEDVDALDLPDSIEEWAPPVLPPPPEPELAPAPTKGPAKVTFVQMRPTTENTTESFLLPRALAQQQAAVAPSASTSSSSVIASAIRPPRPPTATAAAVRQADDRPRHDKGGVRPRGCPCCDPDNIENIIDKILFLDVPP